MLKVPYAILYPLIPLFCLIGVYTVNNNAVEIFIMVVSGIAGLLLLRAGFEGAPLLLALVLGPLMESSLRQSLLISRGSFAIFFNRPVAAVLMLLSLTFLLTSIIPAFRTKGGESPRKWATDASPHFSLPQS